MRYQKKGNLKIDTAPNEMPRASASRPYVTKPNPTEMTNDEQVNAIIDYENGTLAQDETIRLFQHLVNTGLAWRLQGHYGRTAMALIHAGLVHHA